MTLKPANAKDNSKRRFNGSGPRPDNNEIKQSEASERNASWSKLSPKEQLEALDRRLGKGVGAAKQRARLQGLISNPKTAKFKGTPVPTSQVPEEIRNDTRNLKAKDRRERERTERPSK